MQAIEKRVSSLLGGIPMDNAEPMQVLTGCISAASLLHLCYISATSLLYICYISAPSRRVRLEHAGDLEALCYLGGQRRRLPNVNLG